MLHFDINKSYVNIVMLHDDTNYLRGGGRTTNKTLIILLKEAAIPADITMTK